MKMMSKTLAGAATLLALAGTANTWAADFYRQRNLVSDSNTVRAENRDMNLVNAWGLALNPFGPAWVADNGTGLSTLYNGEGMPQSLVVTIPGAAGAGGNPTGTVFYGGMEFMVSKGSKSGPARFLFASEDGGIAGWSPTVDPTQAVRVIDNSKIAAIYKGLAISGNGRGTLLYATNFRSGRIDVYDSSFKQVTLPDRPFVDPQLPSGYGPFGIQAINGDIYVSYAKQDQDKHDDVKGAGFGFVSVFDPNGRFLRRLASGGALNAPWGMALAPASFGRFSNRLLVGNFGDGTINAYDIATGNRVGNLKGENGQPIRIDGLWAIGFGNGVANQPIDTLFFTAGPQDEKHGLYGRLDVVDGDDQGGAGAGSQY
jgi:uncharacterized protein (TIGR03118 family)